MQLFKRILFLAGLNIAIIAMLSIVLGLIERFTGVRLIGGDQTGLIVVCMVFGFGGAFINLLLSRRFAKMLYGIKLVDARHTNPKIVMIYEFVKRISHENKIRMPQVGYFNDASPNAFATGATRNSSLVAISTGLLDSLSEDEMRAVVGHEMAHILNGDMITMTLMQGVLNAFVMYLARVLGRAASSYLSGDDEDAQPSYRVYRIVVQLLEVVFGILASLLLYAFSRYREYHADAGGARFTTKHAMVSALRTIHGLHQHPEYAAVNDEYATLKFGGHETSRLGQLLSTHPTLQQRIEYLQSRSDIL